MQEFYIMYKPYHNDTYHKLYSTNSNTRLQCVQFTNVCIFKICYENSSKFCKGQDPSISSYYVQFHRSGVVGNGTCSDVANGVMTDKLANI